MCGFIISVPRVILFLFHASPIQFKLLTISLLLLLFKYLAHLCQFLLYVTLRK